MANATIGYITCPFTGQKKCEVRRDKKMKLYYYGLAGLVKPNLPDGQAYMKKHTKFIGENGSPLAPVNKKPTDKKAHDDSVNEIETVNEIKKGWLENFLSDDE